MAPNYDFEIDENCRLIKKKKTVLSIKLYTQYTKQSYICTPSRTPFANKFFKRCQTHRVHPNPPSIFPDLYIIRTPIDRQTKTTSNHA